MSKVNEGEMVHDILTHPFEAILDTKHFVLMRDRHPERSLWVIRMGHYVLAFSPKNGWWEFRCTDEIEA